MKNRFRNLVLALTSLIVCGLGFAQQTQIVVFRDFSNNNTSANSTGNGPSGELNFPEPRHSRANPANPSFFAIFQFRIAECGKRCTLLR